jgi:hypothetical protein
MAESPHNQQHQLRPGPPSPALVKVGKVLSVHRDDHSLDVVFQDGNIARHVPLLSGQLSTTAGFVGMIAPTYDETVLGRKTYPDAQGPIAQPPYNPSEKGRDQYVALMQMESAGFGTAGYVALGYFAPQVSEMLFDKEFSDMALYRHSSDVQTTLDHTGKLAIQHPKGTRIVMGPDIGEVDLTGKDYDGLYALRNNTDIIAQIYLIVLDKPAESGGGSPVEKSSFHMDGTGNMWAFAQSNLRLFTSPTGQEPDNLIWLQPGSSSAPMQILITSKGEINIGAQGDINISTDANLNVYVKGEIDIEAEGEITVKGEVIRLN